MSELKPKEYKRKDHKEYASSIDLVSESSDIYDLVISSMERHNTRPPVYSNTPEGFEQFKQMTICFIKEIRERNVGAENSKRMRLIPSVEMWATYLGVTRQTINNYEHSYEQYFQDYIKLFKNAIASIKKELAENGKINPMLHVFDFCNNYGYVNTNNFTITPPKADETVFELPTERINRMSLDMSQNKDTDSNNSNITDESLPFLKRKE